MSLRLCLFAYYFFAPWGNLKARCYALDWWSHFSLMRELHEINSEAEKRGKIIFLLTFLKLTYHYIGSKLSFIFKEFLSETVSETDAFPFIIKCLSRPSSLPFSLPFLPFTQCSSSFFFFPHKFSSTGWRFVNLLNSDTMFFHLLLSLQCQTLSDTS